MPRRSSLTLVLSILAAPTLAAQRPVELGIDGGLAFKLNEPTAVQLALPISTFRAGFFVSDAVSIEPRISLDWTKVSELDAFYALSAGLGALFHFGQGGDRARGYVRPFAGLELLGGGGESVSQLQVGGGIGVKLPMVSRLAARLEAGVQQGLENDDFQSSTRIYALFGFSFFTR